MSEFGYVFSAFLTAGLAALLLVVTRSLHGRVTFDGEIGVQKLHQMPTPRVGGIAVVLGVLSGVFWLAAPADGLFGLIFAALLPAFLAGLAEDLTKRVSVGIRLVSTCLAGFLFCCLTGYRIAGVEIPMVDLLLGVWIISALFTGFAIGGIANAVNLIDGVNGLAAGSAVILFGGFALISWLVEDRALIILCLAAMGALSGFLLLNFPMAYLFLGDSGAYSVGFLLACVAVMLPARNPELSPLLGLLALSYPVIETLVSVHRRLSRVGGNPGQPDRLHLHSLVYRHMSRRVAGSLGAPQLRNALTGLILWSFPLLSAALAVMLREQSGLIVLGCAGMLALYLRLYRRVALLGGGRVEPLVRRGLAREV